MTIEKALLEKFSRIFELKFNRLSSPGESEEQDTLFIDVDQVVTRMKDRREVARVTGKCYAFVQADKMPLGYFARKIAAHPELCKDVFFSNFEQNQKGMLNLTVRSFDFMYFFDSQYDPNLGNIQSVTTTVEVTP